MIDYDNEFFFKKNEKNDLELLILLIAVKLSIKRLQDF